MEDDIGRSHITTAIRKVHPVALLYPKVANKHAFESMRHDFREGRRVILDKSKISIDPKRKGEERRGG